MRVTAADRPARTSVGSPRSVRQALAGEMWPLVALLLLVIGAEIVAGWRVVGSSWQGGDLLYHSALANEILRGELPPGGPYTGLPTYYPPGFHVMAAAAMGALGLDFVRADQLLTLVWIPVLPIGTYLLVRRLTGRPWVALLGATLTVFAGAYDLRAGRLWVNSLFMVGHEVYPLYPRDVVFALLPFAFLAFVVGLDAGRPRRAMAWAVVAGALLGTCALVQVQLLVPIPFALAAVALAIAVRRPARRVQALAVLGVTVALAFALVAPWLADQAAAIRTNGGVALASSDQLLPARFGPWSYAREFGLLLPFGILGSGVALLFLRRDDGPRPGGRVPGPWRPSPAEAPLGLVVWFTLPFAMAVFYQPTWPFTDALQPQRLWLLAGQPMTMLAAIGLVATAEDLTGRVRRWRSDERAPRWGLVGAAVLVAGVTLAACVPTSVMTARLLSDTWASPTYAHLDLRTDRVPAFSDLLPARGGRETVLTYEDWSSLAWYETGHKVVGLLPAGYAKLAYDPGRFTTMSQAARRSLLVDAFDGDPSHLASAAEQADAQWIVIARRGDRLGWFDAAAMPASSGEGLRGPGGTVVNGNGWDGVALPAGSWLDLPVLARGPADLEIRILGSPADGSVASRRFKVRALGPDGSERSVTEVAAPAARDEPWQVLPIAVDLEPGDRLRIEAIDPITVQSVRGFLPASVPLAVASKAIPGWQVAAVTPDAVLLEPAS